MVERDKLKELGLSLPRKRKTPLWAGPGGEGKQGGVTQSLLSRYLCCKERFRIKVVEGLVPDGGFNHKLEFGNLWHVCEEALAGQPDKFQKVAMAYGGQTWDVPLQRCAQDLCKRHPTQQQEIDKWYYVVKVQFPQYVKFWANHPDVTNRTPLLAEQVFDVSYLLPSGRVIRLRGKWDSVDLVETITDLGNGKKMAQWSVWLQENKSKGQIIEQQIKRQLTFDLQTMTYLVALEETSKRECREVMSDVGTVLRKAGAPIRGIRYNVIRRPLSGGAGTIVQKKATAGSKCPKCKGEGIVLGSLLGTRQPCPKCNGLGRVGGKPGETKEAYYARLAQYIKDAPQDYFMRWECPITQLDIDKFKRECLDPVLENLCDDWEWWESCSCMRDEVGNLWDGELRHRRFPHHFPRHFRLPFGIYNPIAEEGSSEVDEYLATGSTVGLRVMDDLFPEL